jgi:hypothetical protein
MAWSYFSSFKVFLSSFLSLSRMMDSAGEHWTGTNWIPMDYSVKYCGCQSLEKVRHFTHYNRSDECMFKLQLTGQNLGWVFNSRSGCMGAMHLCCIQAKWPSLLLYLASAGHEDDWSTFREPSPKLLRLVGWRPWFQRPSRWPEERDDTWRRPWTNIIKLFRRVTGHFGVVF